MGELKCAVVPLGEEEREYGCGHTGPAKWNINLFGREFQVPTAVMNGHLCGQCHANQFTQCVRCGEPIAAGDGCIIYGDREGIHCLGEHCGPGPISGNPGVWDGTTFNSDFVTGRGMCTFPRC